MKNSTRNQLEENGYVVVRDLLNPATDLEPLRIAYSRLVDELAEIYTRRTESGMPADYNRLSFPDRLCYLTGISHGKAYHHLDPIINILDESYSLDSELPSAQLPEMFDLICNPAILSTLKDFIGPEIYSAPLFHNNIKTTREQLIYMDETSTGFHGSKPGDRSIYDFFLGTTVWHTDSHPGLADARESNIISAWIPLTESTIDNGCLLVVPGSHRLEHTHSPPPEEVTKTGIPVETAQGDVVFFGNNLLHSSLDNTSDDNHRWAFNTRYCPVGEPTGKPYLPGFIAHSLEDPSRVLKDAAVWQRMWSNALENIAVIQPVPPPRETSLEDAMAISRYWKEKTPDPDAWLNLNK